MSLSCAFSAINYLKDHSKNRDEIKTSASKYSAVCTIIFILSSDCPEWTGCQIIWEKSTLLRLRLDPPLSKASLLEVGVYNDIRFNKFSLIVHFL